MRSYCIAILQAERSLVFWEAGIRRRSCRGRAFRRPKTSGGGRGLAIELCPQRAGDLGALGRLGVERQEDRDFARPPITTLPIKNAEYSRGSIFTQRGRFVST